MAKNNFVAEVTFKAYLFFFISGISLIYIIINANNC